MSHIIRTCLRCGAAVSRPEPFQTLDGWNLFFQCESGHFWSEDATEQEWLDAFVNQFPKEVATHESEHLDWHDPACGDGRGDSGANQGVMAPNANHEKNIAKYRSMDFFGHIRRLCYSMVTNWPFLSAFLTQSISGN